jgi:hypothetical protein
MLMQPIARSFDLNDDGRSRSAVATTGPPKISPDSAKPRLEVENHRTLLMAAVDELEERIATAGAIAN